ncbi:MAG: LemA family protein [Thermoplasmatota archaeon]
MAAVVIAICGVLFILVMVILVWIVLYNRLARARNGCQESWSDIQTELKRRYDLIPNIVKTVKAYAKHERDLLNELTRLREDCLKATGKPSDQQGPEQAFENTLHRLMVRLENYPDLKASRNYLELQRELSETEDRIQASLRLYNANVRELENLLDTFPSNIVSRVHDFTGYDFFEVGSKEVAQRMQEPPELDL